MFQATQGIWWGGLGGGGGGDNVRWNIHTYSMLHVFQGRKASGGVGWVGGVGEVITSAGASVPVYLLRAVFLNCLFFLGLFCFPSALFWFLAPLSFRFSAIRARILWAKG